MPTATTPSRRQRIDRNLNLLLFCIGLLAVVSICLQYGFDTPPVSRTALLAAQWAAIVCYVGVVAYRVISTPLRLSLRRNWHDLAVLAGAAVVLVTEYGISRRSMIEAGAVYVGTLQALVVLRVGMGAVRLNLAMSQRTLKPARLMALSFLGVIIVGGGLLSLPRAMSVELRQERGHYATQRIVNCFFTATSATCVTGLVVYDTGRDFTTFGQIVILVLIQLGGLGIMMFSSVFGLLAGKQLSLKQSLILQDALSHRTVGQIGSMIRFILVSTFLFELIGALLLYPMYRDRPDAAFCAVFHAISAFCNAGFSLHTHNLVEYAGSWSVYVSIMPLIVLGGLGFPVLSDLWGWVTHRWEVRRAPAMQGMARPVARRSLRPYRLRLHTKLVLTTTLLLIVVPAAMLFLLESKEWRSRRQREQALADPSRVAMVDRSAPPRALAALFQSVTARTAGFNTVPMDVASMSGASHFLICVLMFVGGSPGSTAGGVKTAAAAVLVLGVWNTLRNRSRVEAFGRSIPDQAVGRAAAVVVVMFLLVTAIVLVLLFTEASSLHEVLFESVSAFGTVGLSTGLTERLTVAGRLTIMLAMFAGRLGPLTVLIALAGETAAARYEYPMEDVAIG